MIKAFTSQSAHTLKMPNKPIREGFKMQGLGDRSYIQHFLWYSRTEGISQKPSFKYDLSTNPYTRTAKLVANLNLSNTASAVLQLAKTLPYTEFEFSLFNDNLFNKPELFRQLKALGIRACSTTCKDITTLVFRDSLDNQKLAQGTLQSKISSLINKDTDTILILVQQDSAVVRLVTTIYTRQEQVLKERKKPKASLTNLIITRALFEAFLGTNKSLIAAGRSRASKEYVHCRLLPIPGIVDNYNHFMNSVDIANQL